MACPHRICPRTRATTSSTHHRDTAGAASRTGPRDQMRAQPSSRRAPRRPPTGRWTSRRGAGLSWPDGLQPDRSMARTLPKSRPTGGFYAGGGGSVRGYGFQDIGPVNGAGNPTGGRSVLETSAELRIGITDTIGIVPFVDAGLVKRQRGFSPAPNSSSAPASGCVTGPVRSAAHRCRGPAEQGSAGSRLRNLCRDRAGVLTWLPQSHPNPAPGPIRRALRWIAIVVLIALVGVIVILVTTPGGRCWR